MNGELEWLRGVARPISYLLDEERLAIDELERRRLFKLQEILRRISPDHVNISSSALSREVRNGKKMRPVFIQSMFPAPDKKELDYRMYDINWYGEDPYIPADPRKYVDGVSRIGVVAGNLANNKLRSHNRLQAIWSGQPTMESIVSTCDPAYPIAGVTHFHSQRECVLYDPSSWTFFSLNGIPPIMYPELAFFMESGINFHHKQKL